MDSIIIKSLFALENSGIKTRLLPISFSLKREYFDAKFIQKFINSPHQSVLICLTTKIPVYLLIDFYSWCY